MVEHPSYKMVDGKKCLDIDSNDMDTIIFKIEGAVKEMLFYLAKSNNNDYGSTITAVLARWIKDKMEDEGITFSRELNTLRMIRSEKTKYERDTEIKKNIRKALADSKIENYVDLISAGTITMQEAQLQVARANAHLLEYIEQGYNPNEIASTKKSFGYKWSEGSWIYEISRKIDEEETILINNKQVTRKKVNPDDRHYFQYQDNGIEVILPNIFENALYLEYYERDEYFNRELRKVSGQGITYGRTDDSLRFEYKSLVEEFCPKKNIEEVDNYILQNHIKMIGTHLVKLQRKGERKFRYICIDTWNERNDEYRQFVFMKSRGGNTFETAKEFYGNFTRVLGKKDKPIPIKTKEDVSKVGFTSETSEKNPGIEFVPQK